VGESGVGKTTVINTVIGYHFPDSGTITIDGHNIRDIDLRSYRKHIAVVPQNTILFSGTIRDNITYGLPSVSEEKLAEILEAARLTEMVEKLPHGLDTSVGEHGGKLSGGQRQRISIARALIRDPKVIILDEATSALDSVSEKKIQEALDVLTAGRTTFVVAHRLSTIKDADKIAVMESGRCVECGTYDELMEKKGAFYKYRQLQL
jgi:ATP-binding cassette subfamily B protein